MGFRFLQSAQAPLAKVQLPGIQLTAFRNSVDCQYVFLNSGLYVAIIIKQPDKAFQYFMFNNYCQVRLADKPWLKVSLADLL